MVGESSRRLRYPKPLTEAVADVERAMGAIGKVLEVSSVTSTILGRTRYGLQSVKLRVSVLDGVEGSSVIEIAGAADDLWGAGARKGADKLVRALEAL